MPTQLTKNFTLEELTSTSHRNLDNTPSEEIVQKLQTLAEFLETVRAEVGPLHTNSGYRSPEVNKAVGGAPTSQHTKGEAADVVPTKLSLKAAAKKFLKSGIEFDQFIYEFGSWLHFSYAPEGRPPRNQALMIGKWTDGKYLPLDLDQCP